MKLPYNPSSTTHIFFRRTWDILEILEIVLKKETIYNPSFHVLVYPKMHCTTECR